MLKTPFSKSQSTTTTRSTTLDSDEYYYDDDEEYADQTTEAQKTTTQRPTTTTKPASKPPKGYDSFIKSIPKPVTRLQPVYDDHDDSIGGTDSEDDDYYYDEDYVFHVPPPNKYMPMSETRSPRPTPTYGNYSSLSKYPFLSSTKTYYEQRQTTAIPSIISFPKDIFQDIKPLNYHLPRYLNKTVPRPYTLRPRLHGTQVPEEETSEQAVKSTTTIAPTTVTTTTNVYPKTTTVRARTTTTRKIYTIRPNRGQSKWKISKSVKTGDTINQLELDEKSPNRYWIDI